VERVNLECGIAADDTRCRDIKPRIFRSHELIDQVTILLTVCDFLQMCHWH